MGYLKDQQEIAQHRFDTAKQIAASAGVLVACEIHSDQFLRNNLDDSDAYAIGTNQYEAGELKDDFESLKQMKDYIKDAIEEHSYTECVLCSKANIE